MDDRRLAKNAAELLGHGGGGSCLNDGFCTRAVTSRHLLVRRQRGGWSSSLLRAATLSPGAVVSSPPPPPPPALRIGSEGH
jgi:hypothetical protein